MKVTIKLSLEQAQLAAAVMRQEVKNLDNPDFDFAQDAVADIETVITGAIEAKLNTNPDTLPYSETVNERTYSWSHRNQK